MSLQRDTLTPQMADYDDLLDRGETSWLPYLMYFHRTNYRSVTVNTDRLGFRFTELTAGHGGAVSPADIDDPTAFVNLLVGSSVVFGVGATSDATSIPSRLSMHGPGSPWLNFGGRGYCSAQEFLLFLLHRHLLPNIGQIVIMGGLNDLILAGLPRSLKSEYGAFFFCGDYYSKMDELKTRYRKAKRQRRRSESASILPPATWDGPDLTVDERIQSATEQISRNLDNWRLLAAAVGTRLTFILQPLATWIRNAPAAQERALFDELDSRESDFWRRLFGATSDPEVGENYVDSLSRACANLGMRFLDMNSALAKAINPEQWLFVDRAHFNDEGYDVVSRIIAAELGFA